MRYRLSVSDASTGLGSDVVVECAPTDPVGAVLAMIESQLPVRGRAVVLGRQLEPGQPVAESPIRDGVVLRYGPSAAAEADPFQTPVTSGGVALRVVSGPSAGLTVALRNGAALEIGRSSQSGLVLADGDVSRRHAVVRGHGGGFVIEDAGSANGVLLDGRRLDAPHLLRAGDVVQLGASRIRVEDRGQSGAMLTRATDGAYLINRRFPDRREPFDPPAVTLPTPLAEDDARGLPLLAMLLPMVLAVAMALFLRSPVYLLFGLLSPVMIGGNWWSDRRRRRAREQRQQGSYGDKLLAARARIEAAVDDEDADLRARMPDAATVSRCALELHRDLWSRRPGTQDWLLLRVGTTDRVASVVVTGERPVGWSEPVLRSAPVGVELEAVGVFGLAGPDAWLHDRLAWVITQCAVLHSADELQLVVVAPGAREDTAGWMRWLPHARDTTGGVVAAWHDEDVEALVRSLGDIVAAAASGTDRGAPPGRIVVVLVGAGDLVRRPAIADLLVRGAAHGLRFVCADHDERLLPDSCRAVLVDTGGRTVLRVDGGMAVTVAPDSLADGVPERIARTLAPLRRIGDAPTAGIPDVVRFTDVVSVPQVDELRAAWRLSPENTDVVIGRDGDGLATVDIARHGPHAVVAGTSGAGKSELLQTWVGALALANSPERLSVVFMDYKGGAAFRDLVPLPHVVGTVTNLDARLAVRALASLRAELTRRQEQLAAAGAVDRSDYLRRAAADPALPPFPRLLVIVDELAELKEQLPALVDGLVGVARIGRSLGVHLVLATQKPAGVVDAQIRANVDLRVCLRTRDEGESLDVIEVGDAARIPKERPGRALVVRGGSAPELVQSARITTPVDDGSEGGARVVPIGWTAPVAPARADRSDGLATDLQAVVDTVAAAARLDGLAAPYRPWTSPLAEVVVLDGLPIRSGT
ncbi:MAG: FHA domain-containing protein, partial [Pseudonocardia sp.]|nr:FHA domain-containing protein [Pseudonocardia sp.]